MKQRDYTHNQAQKNQIEQKKKHTPPKTEVTIEKASKTNENSKIKKEGNRNPQVDSNVFNIYY